MATAVFPSMTPFPNEGLQPLLVKAGYWAQSSAEAVGGSASSGMLVYMTPAANDSVQVLTYKLAYWLQQLAGGGGGGGGGGSSFSHLLLRDSPSTPEPDPPSAITDVWFVSFRDGSSGKIWDPDIPAWI